METKELLKKIRKLDIRTKKLVNEVFSGEYHSVFKGRGMDFREVREYIPGDDIRAIDWNVTARTGKPHIKIFEEERELTVFLMVDVSRSGEFGTAKPWHKDTKGEEEKARMKREIALEICALLAFSAIENKDLVGLLLFTDEIKKTIMPKKGRLQVLRILREIANFDDEKKNENKTAEKKSEFIKKIKDIRNQIFYPKTASGSLTNLAEPLDYLNRVTKRKAIVFLISDFMGSGYEKSLAIAAKKHDLIPIVITDPLEESIPKKANVLLELEDAETGASIIVDTNDPKVRSLFDRKVSEYKGPRDKMFKRLGLDVINIRLDRPYINELTSFFRKRSLRY